MNTGETIAALRARTGLTQEQLAAELYVSRDLVSKWETGKSMPDYKMLLRIANRFSVDVAQIFDQDRALREELAVCIPDGAEADPVKLKKEINRFLYTLSVRDRAVFIRRYYYFENTGEIGAAYGINESTVRSVLLRTRRKLKKFLKGACT